MAAAAASCKSNVAAAAKYEHLIVSPYCDKKAVAATAQCERTFKVNLHKRHSLHKSCYENQCAVSVDWWQRSKKIFAFARVE